MPPKSKSSTETKKSILIVPSRVINRPDELEGGEETEITAQISVPEEGGWGWVVVAAAFGGIMMIDGICYTFGSLIQDIKKELKEEDSKVAFINSLAASLYFLCGPLASACINRFGFRSCCMSGAVIVSCSLLCSYFTTNYATLCIFYGGFAGFGYSFINLSCSLVVGFYFEKLRALALSIAATGSSVGISIMFPINTYICKIAGWRVVTLFHSGLIGLIYFYGMTFRPLLSLTVATTTDDPTKTVTYLPNLSTSAVGSRATLEGGLMPTATERLFSAVSNANFPTAASIVTEGVTATPSQPGTSAAGVSRLTLTARSRGGISRRQLKQVQSIVSRPSVQDKNKPKKMEITVNIDEPKKRSCWQSLCHWDEHIPESRPMYRDDAFYEGKIEKLPEYQKSMMDTLAETKTGLEYQMAVSRAVTAADLKEQRGVFTTAARRVLATMVDPKLLKKKSFLILSISGLIVYLGYLVPYVFIKDRNENAGIDEVHCNLFVTVIGIANAVGRLVLGGLATKYDALKLYWLACCMSGITTALSTFTYNVYYQYGYCLLFGFFISSFSSLRSIVIVSLYGLDKLTNATGIILLFQGFGSLSGTPLAGFIKKTFGYQVSFYVAGSFMLLGGLIAVPVRKFAEEENAREQNLRKK